GPKRGPLRGKPRGKQESDRIQGHQTHGRPPLWFLARSQGTAEPQGGNAESWPQRHPLRAAPPPVALLPRGTVEHEPHDDVVRQHRDLDLAAPPSESATTGCRADVAAELVERHADHPSFSAIASFPCSGEPCCSSLRHERPAC